MLTFVVTTDVCKRCKAVFGGERILSTDSSRVRSIARKKKQKEMGRGLETEKEMEKQKEKRQIGKRKMKL